MDKKARMRGSRAEPWCSLILHTHITVQRGTASFPWIKFSLPETLKAQLCYTAQYYYSHKAELPAAPRCLGCLGPK